MRAWLGVYLLLGLIIKSPGQTTMHTSPNPKTTMGVKVTDMIKLNYPSLFKLPKVKRGGIVASVSPEGFVNVKVYAFDDTKSDGKGRLVYDVLHDVVDTNQSIEKSHTIVLSRSLDYETGFPLEVTTQSNDIKKLGQYAGYYKSDVCMEGKNSWTHKLGKFVWAVIVGGTDPTGHPCDRYTPEYPVIVEVTVKNAVPRKITIPGIGDLTLNEIERPVLAQLPMYLNPNAHPNFIMLAAHRGYWKDVTAENSIEALQHAIEMKVEMVEIDVRETADGELVLAHDYHLGRITDIPAHIQGRTEFQENGRYMIKKMTLRDLRPDLYSDKTRSPVYLLNGEGVARDKIPTLKEAFEACKYKIMIDIDKVEGFYHRIYDLALNMDMLNQIVVKGRFDSPQKFKQSVAQEKFADRLGEIDWKKFMTTPVFFPEFEVTANTLKTFFSDPDFNCPGVELVYMNDPDKLTDLIPVLKDHNKQIIQFPQYPENTAGVYNPKRFQYSDIDPRIDHRNDWEWLLDNTRRPTLIITDRLEVLLELLELKKLRDK